MRHRALTALLLGFCCFAANLEAASPRLNIITPRGGQRGAETVFTFSGSALADTAEILFYEPGFEVVKLEPNPNGAAVVATIKIAPTCRIGEHTAQLRTATGLSDYRTFYVGPYPTAEEKEPNSAFDAPQPITLNVTVDGIVQSEDVDYYLVEAKAGQRISAEVEAMRLGTFLFDPYVAILNSKRFELSADDDTPLAYQDAIASIVAPEDGQYIIQIRESAYAGNGNCRYRLHIGTFPRPTAAYPAGGQRGTQQEVTYLGLPGGELKATIAVPAEAKEEIGIYAEDAGGIAPSANVFRLYDAGNSLELEPNNDFQTASPAQLPNAFNGIINQPGDVDFFKFTATKGQVFEVECYGRRIRSPLDPVVRLYNSGFGAIAANDDSRGPDSYFRFSVPADGEYYISVEDHLMRGGADFIYRLEFQPIVPKLTLSIPRVSRYGQERQQITVHKGNRYATLMLVTRNNFGGEVIIDGGPLLPGMTMTAEQYPANMTLTPVLFEAAPDAVVGGKLIPFTGRHVDPNTKIAGGFNNSAIMILGDNQQTYWEKNVDQLAIAVGEEAPFKIDIVEPKAPLCQSGSMNLKIVATRKEGFNDAITVEFPFRPNGVSAAGSVQIPAGQNEVMYPINAAGNAEVKSWKVYALAHAQGYMVSSQLAKLDIVAPFLTLAVDRGATEQGKPADVLVKVTVATPFEGTAKVQLVGLPHKVETTIMEITKDTPEFIFKVTTDATSPEGTHKGIFCVVTVPVNGEESNHRAGDTTFRVDKPLPPPVAKKEEPMPMPMPVAEVKPEPPKEAPPRPLTRLEKLRLEAETKRKEAAGNQ